MKRKEIKISTYTKIIYIGVGACMLCHGISDLFNESLLTEIIKFVLMFTCFLLILSTYIFKEEKHDEMAKKNLACARANGLKGIFFVMLVALIVQGIVMITRIDYEISFMQLTSFILAAFCLSTGISFLKYEKDGGAWLN